ncbi:hypothetical protein DYH10_00815 [Candidatus Saccharibacteria bacterium CPR2]|nr:hypothetical protein [Candidatus Saccharibacteria bacterium CPR2]
MFNYTPLKGVNGGVRGRYVMTKAKDPGFEIKAKLSGADDWKEWCAAYVVYKLLENFYRAV